MSKSSKAARAASGPSKLSKTGKKAGVELSEGQLGLVTGGVKYNIKI
jgi:hypothetical protein